MANATDKGKISQLPDLATLNDSEYIELIHTDAAGQVDNYKFLLSKLQTGAPGLSAYEIAVKNGFQGTETEWLDSLKGKSSYQIAVDLGFVGTEEEFIASLKGDAGKSAYEVAVENGFQGTEQEWLTSLHATMTAELLQTLLNQQGYTVKDVLRVTGKNGGLSSNAAFHNFAFLFDKRLNQDDLTAGDKVPQRMMEQGRMEAEGYSYLKNASAPTTQGALPELPESEIRIYDNGEFQIGSLTDYIAFKNDGNIRIVEGADESTVDLKNLPKNEGISGGVFVKDVQATDPSQNVGSIVRTPDGHSVQSCLSTTSNVRVIVDAITGHSSYVPSVKINNVDAVVTPGVNPPMWIATADIDLGAPTTEGYADIVVEHADGAKFTTKVLADTPANITSAVFTGGYPLGQTELKEDDLVAIKVVTDENIVAYEIADFGALKESSGTVAPTKELEVTGLYVADRGNTTKAYGFRVRVQKSTGSWSEWFTSSDAGSEDKINTMQLNDLRPVVNIGQVTYPSGQSAIKVGETATVANTVSNADSVVYSSPNDQLTITSANEAEIAKVVTYKSGTYNDSTNNLLITAKRAANGSVATATAVVAIANAAPTAMVTYPAARLRSGGNFGTQVQSHVITLTSTQKLSAAPAMNAPGGKWATEDWKSDATGKVWTRALLVHDDDPKGTYDFNSVVLKGLAGVEANSVNGGTYVLGGFVFRTLSVAAWPNRETDIGTEVTNTGKLRCSNLSKGSTGSLNFTYKADDANQVDTYTIKDGNKWYNCDSANAVSNTTGLMKIELEEVV